MHVTGGNNAVFPDTSRRTHVGLSKHAFVARKAARAMVAKHFLQNCTLEVMIRSSFLSNAFLIVRRVMSERIIKIGSFAKIQKLMNGVEHEVRKQPGMMSYRTFQVSHRHASR